MSGKTFIFENDFDEFMTCHMSNVDEALNRFLQLKPAEVLYFDKIRGHLIIRTWEGQEAYKIREA